MFIVLTDTLYLFPIYSVQFSRPVLHKGHAFSSEQNAEAQSSGERPEEVTALLLLLYR